MDLFMPYLVILLVAAIFCVGCYWLFRDTTPKKSTYEPTTINGSYYRRESATGTNAVGNAAGNRTQELKQKYKIPTPIRSTATTETPVANTVARTMPSVEPVTVVKQEPVACVQQAVAASAAPVQASGTTVSVESVAAMEPPVSPTPITRKTRTESGYGSMIHSGDTLILPAVTPEMASTMVIRKDTTQAMPVVAEAAEPANTADTATSSLWEEVTQVLPKVTDDLLAPESLASLRGETLEVSNSAVEEITNSTSVAVTADSAVAMGASLGAGSAMAATGEAAMAASEMDTVVTFVNTGAAALLERMVDHFSRSVGWITDQQRKLAQEVTQVAFAKLGITEAAQVEALFGNILVQEALHHMQKAYVATPEPWMRDSVVEAFVDVVKQPKSSTLYLVAFDALRIMTHLTQAHFQVLAIALLFQYGCHSNNYSLKRWKHYMEKYVAPFLTELPCDEALYGQLRYLQCTQEDTRHSLSDLLVASYPYVFTQRGFTKDELAMALCGEKMPPQFIVKSLNSAMIKLAIIGPEYWGRFFAEAGIADMDMQRRLRALMESRPVNFTGSERDRVLSTISPTLSSLADMYDHSPLAQSALTLPGIYLGRMHVKVIIGKEYDLSRWF